MVNQRSQVASRKSQQSGFTLIELIVVVTIIGILAGIAVVQVKYATRKALESALMQDLHEMRKAIDDFYADKQRYPTDLNELVPNYLRKIPPDPITKAVDWEAVQNKEDTPDQTSTTDSSGAPQGPGISDVKCPAPGQTLDGRAYADL
ncbi:MAG: type II secretion system protein [Thermoanaerobaculia bacterium]